MKKIAFITDGWERYVTYAWIQGYRRYMAEHPLTADLYVFHSFGNFSKDQNFNTGEYNIIQLPDLSAFDGIILDLANILNVSIKEKITELAAKASVPVVSLMEKIPGMYFSGIDNQNAVRTLVEHLSPNITAGQSTIYTVRNQAMRISSVFLLTGILS